MERRGRRAARHQARREKTEAREAIERRWRDRLADEPRLAALVTARGASEEPFHRWVHYKQGFAPALVRRFLNDGAGRFDGADARPVLDPFAGSGTCVIECGRRGVPAIGVEALESLAFLVSARNQRELPPWPGSPTHVHLFPGGMPTLGGMPALKAGMSDDPEDMAAQEATTPPIGAAMAPDDWRSIAPFLTHPLHRAALMLAEGRRYTSAGRLNRGAEPLPTTIADVLSMIREDLVYPLPIAGVTHHGDARRLSMIDDASIGGILTSPPYLSRHDYASIAGPYERVYRHWFPTAESGPPRSSQMAGRVQRGRGPNVASPLVGGGHRADVASPLAGGEHLADVASPLVGGEPRADVASPLVGGEHLADVASPLVGGTPAGSAIRHSPFAIPSDLPPSQGGTEGGPRERPIPDAAREAADQLDAIGERKLAAVVRAYFVDLAQVLSECHRVLAPGGPFWLVIGGARLAGVHIPSDIIAAELAESLGFRVAAVRVAREVTNSRRKFGRLGHVAPRESVIVMSKR